MGLLAFITMAYDIFSKTRNTKTRPLRSSGSFMLPPANAAPAFSVPGAGAARGESGTTGTGFTFQLLLQPPQPPNQLDGLNPNARSLVCVSPWAFTTRPRW